MERIAADVETFHLGLGDPYQPVAEVAFSVCGWREGDGEDEGGGFGVDERDQAEDQQTVGLEGENEGGAGLQQ